MAVHETLRQVVAARGSDPTSDPAAWQSVLAQAGISGPDAELLTAVVTTGAVRRLAEQLDQGADPWASVHEAGTEFAEARGSQEVIRCCWAVAAVGFAIGRVEASVVETFDATAATTREVPDSPAGNGGSPPGPPPSGPPGAGGPNGPPPSGPPGPPPGGPPGGPLPPPTGQHAGSRPVGLIVLIGAAAVLLIVTLAVAGVVVVRNVGSGSDEPAKPDAKADGSGGKDSEGSKGSESNGGSDTGGQSGGSEGSEEPRPAGAIPDTAVVVPYNADGSTRLYQVDLESGESQLLTDGPGDGLPSISPTRTQMAYLTDTATPGKRVRLLDLSTGENERLFDDASACAFGNRPAFRPHGQQVALVCTDDRRNPTGLYLADLDGNLTTLAERTDLGGAPTWVDDDTLLFDVEDAAGVKTFFKIDVSDPDADPVAFDIGTDGRAVSHTDWSPEAGALIYLRTETVNGRHAEFGQIWLVRPPQPALLLDTPGAVGHPAWSPDGTRIVVVVEQDGLRNLATFPLDDPQSLTTVTTDVPGLVGIPAWGTR